MKAIRWTPVVLLIALLVSVAVAVAGPWSQPEEIPVASQLAIATATPSEAAPTSTPMPPPERELVATDYAGPPYDVNLITEPTLPTAQSRLWFNDGSWWGLLVSDATNRVTIHELHWDSQRWVDTGVLVDARPFARHDALWDGTTLVVAGAGPRNSLSHALQVARFGYDPDARRYALEPDSPQLITTTGVEVPTLAPAPNGQVWLAYTWSRDLYLTHTAVDRPAAWSAPTQLADQEDDVEVAALVGTDDGVAVAWTTLDDDQLSVARHADGSPDGAWQVDELIVDGLRYGEDEMSVRATSDGTVLALLRTSLDRVENRNLDAPQLVLAQLAGSEWSTSVVARVRDGHAGPSLVVDEARGDVYVFAEADGGVYAKRAHLDDLAFVTGPGIRAIAAPEVSGASAEPSASAGPSARAEPDVPEIVGPTSTKQDVGSLSEIVMVASDDVTGRYAHAIVSVPDGREAPDAQGHLAPLPDGVVEGVPPGTVAYVFRESFSPYAPGPAARSGWQTRSEPADELATIAEPTAGDPSLRLVTNAAGDGTRACKAIAAATSGIVQIQSSVQVRGTPEGDATVTSLRSNGEEIAAVRFGGQGMLRYFSGDERITTAVPYQAGQWYRSILTLRLGTQTYSWQLAPLGSETPILSVDNLPLRGPAPVVDEVCVQAADAAPGSSAELLIDDVLAAVGPGG
jgi:hypothetical protein